MSSEASRFPLSYAEEGRVLAHSGPDSESIDSWVSPISASGISILEEIQRLWTRASFGPKSCLNIQCRPECGRGTKILQSCQNEREFWTRSMSGGTCTRTLFYRPSSFELGPLPHSLLGLHCLITPFSSDFNGLGRNLDRHHAHWFTNFKARWRGLN